MTRANTDLDPRPDDDKGTAKPADWRRQIAEMRIPPSAYLFNALTWSGVGVFVLQGSGETSWKVAAGWILIGIALSSLGGALRTWFENYELSKPR
jgi:hypothetical protein